jgi:hypothetical protein
MVFCTYALGHNIMQQECETEEDIHLMVERKQKMGRRLKNR